MRLFIKNLPLNLTEEELNKLISNYGTVKSVKIITNADTGESRGFAFVDMASREEGLHVIKKLNGESLEEKILVVEAARPKK